MPYPPGAVRQKRMETSIIWYETVGPPETPVEVHVHRVVKILYLQQFHHTGIIFRRRGKYSQHIKGTLLRTPDVEPFQIAQMSYLAFVTVR